MSDPVLSVRNLTIDLPRGGDRPHAVQGISFDIHPNEIVCVVGESGSGKSVTAFGTMGLLPKALRPSGGQILFEGQDLLAMSRRAHAKLRGRKMAMVFQEPMTALNPCFTVGNQIDEIFAAHTKLSAAQRKAKTLALLEEVRLPEPARIYASFPHQLSGGQRQRIVIAMALAMDPKLLIADEPTTALDVTTQAQILSMFKTLKSTHSAGILFVTHDFDVVAEIADRVVVMQKGVMVEQGTVDQVLNHPQHPYTRKLIAAVPRKQPDQAAPLGTQVALSVVELEKTYHVARTLTAPARTVHALHPTSFEVRKGETLGIVGESGSGKTTLVRCLIRLQDPDSGAIWIDGRNFALGSRQSLRSARKDIQIVFQDPYGSLNPRRTVGAQLVGGPLNFGEDPKVAWARARELMQVVQLEEDALYRYPAQFSGGQRQRICIARALMMQPKILIADEAVSALDVSVQKEVLNLLRKIKTEMGLTILFITHDLRVASQISDHLIVMQKGQVVERGPVAEVFGNPSSAYTRQLMAAMPGKGWDVPADLRA
ncbi:peptide/nickel transport system ATP-binding protein [Ketogulonicigenium robustum]|uniref:Peptide/nickel transport system ATP-binding protein n=1 Tax=Ketogulonicigenium robustum TaxID=92947 RepID=A0A1W6P1V5_9RHOB|nr:ABC transporter ATP-binding protein [Ketogulonicigenium robustum]ARO15310.1 peptide/nickel transport system ATP-binding protein [Ketogulonicigenium robustum]